MANPFPLQVGDVAPDFSGRDASPAGDRRRSDAAPVEPFNGNQAAPQLDSPVYPLFRDGYAEMKSEHCAPFAPILTQGDTSGEGTKVYAIDVYSYGDTYDSTAPSRIREADNWTLDSDFDGKRN